MFALVDCNNFYASCERVFRPDLNGKPVVVLSNNDGCIIARSEEAKALGIPMGAPLFMYKELIEKHKVHVFSANYALYGDMSNRVMSILSEYTPDIEIYSIDEAFLKFKGFEFFNPENYCHQIKKRVKKWTGIPIGIGLSYTKTLAKVANRIAKKFPDKTNGVYIINSEEKRIKALKWLKLEDVWGIGGSYNQLLTEKFSLKTAYDFTQMDDNVIRKYMKINGIILKYELLGRPMRDLETPKPKKNIATTRSFEHHYSNFEELHERITTFAYICAEKLRKQNSCCNSLTVFIRTNIHREDLPQYNKSITINLPYATNSSIDLAKAAKFALKTIFKEGYAYKKAGVIVHELVPADAVQGNIFDTPNKKHSRLMEVMDYLNNKLGHHKIRLASQDMDNIWKMKQENLSPHYTTNINDIIPVKA